MTRFLEWLGRVVMLVLAGMITLSIIGAIASIPSGSIETRLGVEPRDWPEPTQSEPQPAPPPAAAPEPSPVAEPGTARVPTQQTIVAAAPEKAATAEQWLESITYVLLALAGLLALGVLLLWRALHHWRRSADALEALARRD